MHKQVTRSVNWVAVYCNLQPSWRWKRTSICTDLVSTATLCQLTTLRLLNEIDIFTQSRSSGNFVSFIQPLCSRLAYSLFSNKSTLRGQISAIVAVYAKSLLLDKQRMKHYPPVHGGACLGRQWWWFHLKIPGSGSTSGWLPNVQR